MIKTVFGWLKWLLIALWLIVLILVGAKLAQQNAELIQVELLTWTLPAASTGFVLCVTLLLGVALGLIAIIPTLVLLKIKLRRANARLRKLDQPPPTLLTTGSTGG